MHMRALHVPGAAGCRVGPRVRWPATAAGCRGARLVEVRLTHRAALRRAEHCAHTSRTCRHPAARHLCTGRSKTRCRVLQRAAQVHQEGPTEQMLADGGEGWAASVQVLPAAVAPQSSHGAGAGAVAACRQDSISRQAASGRPHLRAPASSAVQRLTGPAQPSAMPPSAEPAAQPDRQPATAGC